jgi:hypothetical protein
MTKVNYFQVTGTRNNKEDKELVYARSKKEALGLGEVLGLVSSVESISEMNFKNDLQSNYTTQDLFNIRVRDKKVWKEETKSKEIKVKSNKVKKEV